MFAIEVNTTVFNTKLRRYAAVSGKSIQDAIREEAKIIAQRLVAITPPKTQAQGKRRVKGDLARVYLTSKWFTEIFKFRDQVYEDRVKENIYALNFEALRAQFYRSAKLSRIHLEGFNEGIHRRFRINGRVGRGVAPWSFPLCDEEQRKAYETKKAKMVGYAKSGWAYCVNVLGGSVAGWLSKGANGKVTIAPDCVTITNSTKTILELDTKGRFSQTVIQGRESGLAKKIQNVLERNAW